MTKEETIDRVARLKGLFPYMTVEEEDYWADRLEHFDAAHVDKAIGRYADKRSRDIDRPIFLELIYNEQRREVQDKRERIMSDQKMIAADWQKIDAIVQECSDQDLIDLKTAALAMSQKLNEGAKVMLEKMNPRTSKTLRWLIFQYLEHAKVGSSAR